MSAVDARTEARCWRALAAGALLGTVLLGCGGGDEEPKPEAPTPGTVPWTVAPAAQPLAAPAASGQPGAAAGVVSTAPCDRPALPLHGAQAALHAEQRATEGEFTALTEAGRQHHLGTVPTQDPMAEAAQIR